MPVPDIQYCPLCHDAGSPFYEDRFFLCKNCSGIFCASHLKPLPSFEKERYKTHNNDVNDPRYQQFVSPITRAVLSSFSPLHHGLDYGAGTGPVISKLLQDQGYRINIYDPFFCNEPAKLSEKYDYIVCCEVIEHFHHPAQEFSLLKKLLNPKGSIFCMTDIYNPGIDFSSWYYKNDPTHVFIYQEETLKWIAGNHGFSALKTEHRFIRLDL